MQSTPLFAALNQLALDYDVLESTRGVPYAALRLQGDREQATSLSLIAEHGVCRCIAHAIQESGQGPDALEAVLAGGRLPLGAAYRSPDDGALELSVGWWMGKPDSPLDAGFVGRMLEYTAGAADHLRGGTLPVRPSLQHAPAGQQALREKLQSLGHTVELTAMGVCMRVALSNTLFCDIDLAEAVDGWIDIAAAAIPPLPVAPQDPECIQVLQRLQRWTTAGRFVLSDDQLALHCQVFTPNLGDPLAALVWSASQSAAMMTTAARHLSRATPP